MSMRRLSFLPILLLSLVLSGPVATPAEERPAESIAVSGVVFEDMNRNGTRDEGEPGIGEVRVSDQIRVVATGLDGSFSLQSKGGYGLIFVSQPEGYRVNGRFWRDLSREPESGDLQFPLIKTGNVSDFTFLHASDPHLDEETLPRMRRLREIVVEQEPAFVLLTGDLIMDALRVDEETARAQYELLMQELAEFPVPVWTSLGNHEIFGIERHKSLVSSEHPLYGKQMYRSYLGPNYYSFDHAGVHFVSLDTVGVQDLWYHGYVASAQLAWLREDLAGVAPGTPVVSFSHIPLVTSGAAFYGYEEEVGSPAFLEIDGEPKYRHTLANPESVLDELRERRFVLALAGHFHTREQLFFETSGVQTRFHMISAVRRDYANALGMRMVSGVSLYRVSNGEIDDGTFIPLD